MEVYLAVGHPPGALLGAHKPLPQASQQSYYACDLQRLCVTDAPLGVVLIVQTVHAAACDGQHGRRIPIRRRQRRLDALSAARLRAVSQHTLRSTYVPWCLTHSHTQQNVEEKKFT